MGAAASHKDDKAARARAIRAKIKAVAALTPNPSSFADAEKLCTKEEDEEEEEEEEEEGEAIALTESSEHEGVIPSGAENPCEYSPEQQEEEEEEEGTDEGMSDDAEDNMQLPDEKESDQNEEEVEEVNESEVKIKKSRSKSIRTKIRALASLTPNLSGHRKSKVKEPKESKGIEEKSPIERQESKRDELLDFVKARKDARRDNWSEYEKECESPSKYKKTAWQYERENLELESGEDEFATSMGVRECSMCNKGSDLENIPVCRICGKGYHPQCLTKSGLYTEHELKFLGRAKTKLGWSCQACDNVFNLLTPNELDDLSNEFERLDNNKDGKISLEEYLDHKRMMHEREWGEPMTHIDEEFEKIQFKYLDSDGGGFIEYSEFLKHETCLKLASRPKADLMKLLTPREVLQARQVFEKLDDDEDGFITATDAKAAHRSWYTNLLNSLPKETLGGRSPEEEYGSGDVRATLGIEEEEGHTKRAFDWNEFLQNRAIYIISSRPNKAAAFFVPKE